MQQISIKKNYTYRLFYEVLCVAVSFITAPYISRVLGADGVGIYSYTSSVMTYFTLIAALGTASYGAREISQHRDNQQQSSKLFWEIECMTIVTSMLCLAVWIGVIIYSAQYRYYYVALIPVLLGTMTDISWYFTGLEQIKYIVIRNTVCKLLGLFLLFTLVHDKDDLLLYMIINSLITLAGSLSMWTYLPKLLTRIDIKEIQIKKHFKETLVYFIPTLATSVYTVLDKTLIGIITRDSYENGYYEQASKIINMAKIFVFSSVNVVVGIRNSYLYSLHKYNELKSNIFRSMDFIFFTGMGCVCGIIGISPNFVPLFLGKGYEPVITLLRIMAPIILIIGVSNCLGKQYFTPSGKRKKSAKVIVVGAVINLILNLLMIPTLGSVGATIASLFAESVISILYVVMSDGYMSFKMLWMLSKKRLIAGVTMCIAINEIGKLTESNSIWGLFIQVISGIFLYGILLLIMNDRLLNNLICETLHKLKYILHDLF